MFHQRNNLFFGRLENGDVRLLKLRSAPEVYPQADETFPAHEVQLDVVIPAGEWASIISSVSKTGESYYDPVQGKHKWYIATEFHNGDPINANS